MKYISSLLFIFVIQHFGVAQHIIIDDLFDDWKNITAINDDQNDGNNLELLEVKITDNQQFLYFNLAVEQEIKLYETEYSASDITLYLDTDNDNNTGISKYGIGAELVLDFGQREFKVYYPGVANWNRNMNDLGFIVAPTTTGSNFEFCIDMNYVPFNNIDLFSSQDLSFIFESSTGDLIPNEAKVYQIEENRINNQRTSIEKRNEDNIRVMTYNTLNEGLADNSRKEHFRNIISAINPDIITFNESDVSENYLENLLTEWLNESWYAKTFSNTRDITASKFPIIESYSLSSRMIAVLVDLPDDKYETDLLSINLHAQCCEDDFGRQQEADRFVEFIREVKSGEYENIAFGTPFVLSGDFNFVGFNDQLQTLLSGDIKNESQFGNDAYPDWDDSPIENVPCLHLTIPFNYTWKNLNSYWPPGKLDFIITSDHVINVDKSFVFETNFLDQETLINFNLQSNETDLASDHLPLVADLKLIGLDNVAIKNELSKDNFAIFHRNNEIVIESKSNFSFEYLITNSNGKTIHYGSSNTQENIKTTDYPLGIYYVTIHSKGNYLTKSAFINN